MTFELTNRFRTVHSLGDDEVSLVLKMIEKESPNTFLDFGCHFGHLSFEVALRYPITVYAVDNFVGTVGDERMVETVLEMTDGENQFWDQFHLNMGLLRDRFQGKVVPMKSVDFLHPDHHPVIDFAFVDSSHLVEDAWEFVRISEMIPSGGVFGGHDYSQANYGEGVRAGVDCIVHDYEWIREEYLFFMRKR